MKIKSAASVMLFSILICSGCHGGKDVLFRDEIPCGKDTVSDCVSMSFRSEKDEIYGQILTPDSSYGENRPCVLIFHGLAGFTRFDDVGQALCRAGCVVVIPHHRGAWGSQGKYTLSNCVQDAVNLAQYAMSPEFQKKYHTDPDAVFLAGHSMGGNTVLNAAGKISGIQGVILLDPCDIGNIFRQMSREAMLFFLTENGLNILKTDGPEAVYQDLAAHAQEYAFHTAVKRLNGTAVLRIDAQWGLEESPLLKAAFKFAAMQNRHIPFCIYQTFPCRHSMMGVRTFVAKEIMDFIRKRITEPKEYPK